MRLDVPLEEEAKLRALARLRTIRAENEQRYASHPWPFLCEAVYTFDQFAPGPNKVRKFPGLEIRDPSRTCPCTEGGCVNYLHHVVNIWYQHPRQLWPKSRRLVTSWTMIALYGVWLPRYRNGQVIALRSRKQGQNEDEGAAELIKRARFIEDHLPAEVQPREMKRTWCRNFYPHTNSVVLGIAQGPDQLRGLTITGCFDDENAFWEHAGATYAATLPALEGGGRYSAVSTANPGFMQQLVEDRWHTST